MCTAIGNMHTLARLGEKIYRNRFKTLERSKKGKIIAIDVESGEGFVGGSTIEAGLRAKKKFPGRLFFFKRIGYRAVHSLKGFIPSSK